MGLRRDLWIRGRRLREGALLRRSPVARSVAAARRGGVARLLSAVAAVLMIALTGAGVAGGLGRGGSIVPQASPAATTAQAYAGTWAGTYSANQGLTRVVVVIEPTGTQAFTGHFLFYPDNSNPQVPSGHYTVSGTVDAASGGMTFVGVEWLIRPSTYVFVGFAGNAAADLRSMAGEVSMAGYGTVGHFSVSRLTAVPGSSAASLSPVSGGIAEGPGRGGSIVPQASPAATTAQAYAGTWAGTYAANQGLTRVVVVIEPTGTQDFAGHFLFYPDNSNPQVPSGHYTLSGRVDPQSGTMKFDGVTWLIQPSGYVFVGFDGSAAADLQAMAGQVLTHGDVSIGRFSLERLTSVSASSGDRVVAALRELRTAVRFAYSRDVDRLARASTLISIDRHEAATFNWFAFVWKAIRAGTSVVTGFVSTGISMGVEDFLAGKLTNDPDRVVAGIRQYATYLKSQKLSLDGVGSSLFFAGLLGDFRGVDDFELFPEGYSQLSKAADRYRKSYGSDHFAKIRKAMVGEVSACDHLTVPLRSGPLTPSGVTKTSSWAAMPYATYKALMTSCDEAIAAVPATLPAGTDVDALVAEISAVRDGVKRLNLHVVTYNSAYQTDGRWVVAPRRIALGSLDDLSTVLDHLADCFEKKIDVQFWESAQGTASWPMQWASIYTGAKPKALWRSAEYLDLAASFSSEVESLVPAQELKPMAAMNQVETKMMLSLKENLARLYEITAGFNGYVTSVVSP